MITDKAIKDHFTTDNSLVESCKVTLEVLTYLIGTCDHLDALGGSDISLALSFPQDMLKAIEQSKTTSQSMNHNQ
ncbi:hypothetical protein [Acinetobacter sp. LMB-5]|uniref:hypothetical protein n=1 Tax=Acinetobacter sp. LMB-5 TaxID=1609919 RepID=UPI00076223E9|nr:hypothetical protein [Acinetobacter sp. LMB-5]